MAPSYRVTALAHPAKAAAPQFRTIVGKPFELFENSIKITLPRAERPQPTTSFSRRIALRCSTTKSRLPDSVPTSEKSSRIHGRFVHFFFVTLRTVIFFAHTDGESRLFLSISYATDFASVPYGVATRTNAHRLCRPSGVLGRA